MLFFYFTIFAFFFSVILSFLLSQIAQYYVATKVYTIFKTHALPPVLREDIHVDPGGLLHL